MKKRLKGFFQRLARWLNVREMRQHKVKAGVYIIIRLILVSLFDCRHFKRKMGECHDLCVNARTVDASVVHRPKAVGGFAECA